MTTENELSQEELNELGEPLYKAVEQLVSKYDSSMDLHELSALCRKVYSAQRQTNHSITEAKRTD